MVARFFALPRWLSAMLLQTYLERVYIPGRIRLSPGYEKNLARAVAQFGEHLGRDPAIEDLDEQAIAAWLHSYRRERSDTTTNNVRRMIFTLWDAAADDGLVRPPRRRRVRRLKENQAPPQAWTVSEVRTILEAARAQTGEIAGIPARLWWPSLILAVYWSGCRIGAMRSVPLDGYLPGRGLLIRRQKNSKPQWYDLPETCCESIDRIVFGSRPLLWPWPYHHRTIWKHFRRIVEYAGVRCPAEGLNLFHRLRRTNLSYCDAVDPAIAQRQGGHSTYQVTERYIDRSISRRASAADVLPDPDRDGESPGPLEPRVRPELRVVG